MQKKYDCVCILSHFTVLNLRHSSVCFRLWLILAFLPGLDRVSGGAEKPALSGRDQPAGQEHLLSSTFPLYPLIHVHTSRASVTSFCSGKQHRCSVAMQTGRRELRFSWEEAGVHSRGGQCKEAGTHYNCPTRQVARNLLPE